MQLTLYTDYSLRVLIYLGLKRDRLATVAEIAASYAISRNHLVKVVHNLSSLGYIHSTRGKGGGLGLAHAPGQINLGDVVRHTEMNFDIVACFDSGNRSCPITPVCRLKDVLREAGQAFLNVLDGYTLADVLKNEQRLSAALKLAQR